MAYVYDGRDRIREMPGFIDGVVSYAANGRLAGYTLENRVSLRREYDDKQRVREIVWQGRGNQELAAFRLWYDRDDNVVQRNGDSFSYDGKHQLLSAGLTGDEASEEFTHDSEIRTLRVLPDPVGEKVLSGAEDGVSLDWGSIWATAI
ncbi:hypothetical protein [Spirochaeta africana]|uniref:hypothetical protein n=1 Tax=Spirochaeta africana TaxID=46355 RepID=UPI0002F29BA5|nr:hypothetical protein [Spirochaeta africana]